MKHGDTKKYTFHQQGTPQLTLTLDVYDDSVVIKPTKNDSSPYENIFKSTQWCQIYSGKSLKAKVMGTKKAIT